MKSAVENLNPTRVKLTVEVPFEELRPSMDAAYSTISQQIQVPGFRKGKVPARIIDQRVGRGAVLEQAVNEALPEFYGRAAQEAELRPMGQPQVEVTGVPEGDSGELTFTVEVDVRPTIELPDYEGLAVTVDDIEVTDEDVDERMDQLRARFGTLTGVDRAAADEDFVSIDLTAHIDGEEIETVKGHSYQVGQGNMIDGLDESLRGLSAGESATFTAALAGGPHQGKDAEVSVTVQSVKERVLPPLDDDFAQLASEFDTLDELRIDVSGQVERSKRLQQGVQARDKTLEKLLELVDIPVPDGMVNDEVDRHLKAEDRLEDDAHRAEVEVEARATFKAQLLLDAVVEREELQVSQPELIEYIVQNAQRAGMDPNQFAQAVDSAGQVPAMVGEVARRKALATILEKAVVTDASGNPVDLEALRPQPSPEDLAADALETEAHDHDEEDVESTEVEATEVESTDTKV